jgi:hypothetical protein
MFSFATKNYSRVNITLSIVNFHENYNNNYNNYKLIAINQKRSRIIHHKIISAYLYVSFYYNAIKIQTVLYIHFTEIVSIVSKYNNIIGESLN